MNGKKLSIKYWLLVFILLVLGFLYWRIFWKYRAYTDDAYVQGNQVVITPLQSGFIQSILTDDTYLVEKGALLIRLDDTDAQIAMEKAREELAKTVREVSQSFHEVFVLHAQIQSKKAEFIKAAQDYEHRAYVLDARGVSLEDFEHAVAALRSSFFSLQMTEILFEKALSFVRGTTVPNHPKTQEAVETARQAWVNLHRCNIYSPVKGLAAQRTAQVGMWVQAGDPLMSVIPLNTIWVNANFKETQMRHMKIGQRVKITVDLYGDGVVYQGKIAGLPGGAGNAFSLLPPQNLSGNWIKIVQRLPVRVELLQEELEAHPLRIGLSTEATVDLRDPGPLVPVSSAGSPVYETDIFVTEESGDLSWIDEIIQSNLDPTLSDFADNPIE